MKHVIIFHFLFTSGKSIVSMTYLHQFLLYSGEDSGFEKLGDTSRVYNNRAGGVL